MSDTKKSVFATFGVVMAIGAVYGGVKVREKADVGSLNKATSELSTSHMVASRSNDVNVPAGDYFYELSLKLKEQYVEPVTDDQKLASGAIRGMVASLGDPDSLYYDKDQFRAFLNARVGQYEGIGAELVLSFDHEKSGAKTAPAGSGGESSPDEALVSVRDIPELKVVSVVPGGPAAKAGIKVGDVVDTVDGHWVVQSGLIRQFRIASRKFLEKKLSRVELETQRAVLRKKFDKAIYPSKAKDKLFLGKSGIVNVTWIRGDTTFTTKIAKAPSRLPGFTISGDTVALPFIEGSADKLKAFIQGKNSITIDLRNNTLGDVQVMKQCLEVLAPKGNYGYFVTKRHDSPTALNVLTGNSHPPKVHLITDRSTRGMAEAFALALDHSGLTDKEKLELGGDRFARQIIQLPDGSGYTLVTSAYQVTAPKANRGQAVVAKKGAVK